MLGKLRLLAFLVAAAASTHGEDVARHKTTIIPPTTTPAVTTKLPPSTWTVPPATSSPSPLPTTTTTAATTTATTTTATAATTTAGPSPAPTPTPDTPWVVRDNVTGKICILAKVELHIDIPYKTKDNKTEVGKVDVPKNATVEGSCEPSSERMEVRWAGGSLGLVFAANASARHYWLQTITAAIPVTPQLFPNLTDTTNATILELVHEGKNFVTPLNNSFLCSSELQLNMNNSKWNSTARLSLNHMRLDAFHQNNKTDFSSALECENDESPDIVPIAVGCAIATLIVVVLIAYLVSRRRSQSRGYLSM